MPHEDFLARTEQLLERLVAVGNGAKPAYQSTQVITPDSSFSYDVKTLLDTPAEWDLLSTKVEVLALDDTSGSPTEGYYINAEASVTLGINTGGLVRVHNYRDTPITVRIRIYKPSIKA